MTAVLITASAIASVSCGKDSLEELLTDRSFIFSAAVTHDIQSSRHCLTLTMDKASEADESYSISYDIDSDKSLLLSSLDNKVLSPAIEREYRSGSSETFILPELPIGEHVISITISTEWFSLSRQVRFTISNPAFSIHAETDTNDSDRTSVILTLESGEPRELLLDMTLDGTIDNFQSMMETRGIFPDEEYNATAPAGLRLYEGFYEGYVSTFRIFFNPQSKVVYRGKATIKGSNLGATLNLYATMKNLLKNRYENAICHDSIMSNRESLIVYVMTEKTNELVLDKCMGSVNLYISESKENSGTVYYLNIEFTDFSNYSQHTEATRNRLGLGGPRIQRKELIGNKNE